MANPMLAELDAVVRKMEHVKACGWNVDTVELSDTRIACIDFLRTHHAEIAAAVRDKQARFALNERVQFNNGKHVFNGTVHRIEWPHTIYYVQLDDGTTYTCYGDDPKVTAMRAGEGEG